MANSPAINSTYPVDASAPKEPRKISLPIVAPLNILIYRTNKKK
jgi:hypothetical protein